MTVENFLRSWRTTVIGTAQLVNGIVAISAALSAVNDHTQIEPRTWLIYLSVHSVLNFLGFAFSKDFVKGSDRDQPVADMKLDNIPPEDAAEHHLGEFADTFLNSPPLPIDLKSTPSNSPSPPASFFPKKEDVS